MSTLSSTPGSGTLKDVLERLGVSPDRVLLDPAPGKATEKDLRRVMARTGRLFELVEGTLVEKVMGFQESTLAARLLVLLGPFVEERGLGAFATADGTMRLMPGLVRIPDAAFIRWEKLPGRVVPDTAVPNLTPDLAIEVVSKRNKGPEMKRKRREYFLAGVELVWVVDPRKRTVSVFTTSDPEIGTTFTEADTLTGGEVLPGLALPVARIFDQLPVPGPEKPRRSRPKKSG